MPLYNSLYSEDTINLLGRLDADHDNQMTWPQVLRAIDKEAAKNPNQADVLNRLKYKIADLDDQNYRGMMTFVRYWAGLPYLIIKRGMWVKPESQPADESRAN